MMSFSSFNDKHADMFVLRPDEIASGSNNVAKLEFESSNWDHSDDDHDDNDGDKQEEEEATITPLPSSDVHCLQDRDSWVYDALNIEGQGACATQTPLDEDETLESEHVANLRRLFRPSVPTIVFTSPSPKGSSSPHLTSRPQERDPTDSDMLDPAWVSRDKLDDVMNQDRQQKKRRRERKRRGNRVPKKELRRQISELEKSLEAALEEKRHLKQKMHEEQRQLREHKATPLAKQALHTLAKVAAMKETARMRNQALVELISSQDEFMNFVTPEQRADTQDLLSRQRQSSQGTARRTTVLKSTEEKIKVEHGMDKKKSDATPVQHAGGVEPSKIAKVTSTNARSRTPAKSLWLEAKLGQVIGERELLKAELAVERSRAKAFLSGDKLASKILSSVLDKFEEERSERMKQSVEIIVLKGKISHLQRADADAAKGQIDRGSDASSTLLDRHNIMSPSERII